MKRRNIAPFSLSFLDIMFCGFGAVVLLVLILNIDTVKARNANFADLRAEVVKLEQEVIIGQENLVEVKNSLQATNKQKVVTAGASKRVLEQIRELELEIARMSNDTLASREHSNRLVSDLKSLDKENKRLGVMAVDEGDNGEKIRKFAGQGDRQYLSGLKVGGKRILILIDASASMLGETLINIIRRRNMDGDPKRSAPKWRRTLATADWLVSNIPAASKFQLYSFNTKATPALQQSSGKWLSASNRKEVEGAVSGLHSVMPAGGTSLYHAFAIANSLSPKPDNIILVTDGLPTQGRLRPILSTVSSQARLKHFNNASKVIPSGVPLNTILLPMEGDVYAAAAFWRLALNTHGSMLTPAKDWP